MKINFQKKLAQIDLKEAQDFMNDLIKMSQSYAYHYKNEFSVSKDYVNIRGEDNLFSYTEIKNMVLRLCGNESLKDVLGVILGANIANIDLSISYDEQDISMIE